MVRVTGRTWVLQTGISAMEPLARQILRLATEVQALDCDSFRDSYKDLAQQYHTTTGPAKRQLRKTIDVMERRLRDECDKPEKPGRGPIKIKRMGIDPDDIYSGDWEDGETFLYFPHSKQYFEDSIRETHYILYGSILSKLKISAFSKKQLGIIADHKNISVDELKKNWKSYNRVPHAHLDIVKELGLWQGRDIVSGRTAVMDDGQKVISFWGFAGRATMMKLAKKLKADVISEW